MSITNKIETIGPQKATDYLTTMNRNRPLSNATVAKYAGMMRKKQWLTTHQGIAFDDNGHLIDGQHRLWAVVESNVEIVIMVTRGLPEIVENGKQVLQTMDAIDTLRVRTTADQLFLSHNVTNPTQVHAALSVIGQIATGFGARALTVPQAVDLLALYGKHADIVIAELKRFKPTRAAALAGLLAFARITYESEVDQFAISLVNGTGLNAGDPCLLLRQKLITTGLPTASSVQTGRLDGVRMIANAFVSQMQKKKLQLLRPSEEGLNHLRDKQKANLVRVRNILGVTEVK